MQFDINPERPTLITYTHRHRLVPTKVVPNLMQPSTRYVVPDDRDLFAVYRRQPGPVVVLLKRRKQGHREKRPLLALRGSLSGPGLCPHAAGSAQKSRRDRGALGERKSRRGSAPNPTKSGSKSPTRERRLPIRSN
jgi:hypothetical protein